jgi:hypothetical protein
VNKFKGLAVAVLSFLITAYGQTDKTRGQERQPSDLHYELTAKDGRTMFHLGEAIELEESYSADIAKKYLLLSLPQQVKGHPVQVTIEPSRGVIDRIQDDGKRSVDSILHVNCFDGHGRGIGSGCGDCDWRRPLTSAPVKIPVNLTHQFQITEPGHYSLQAKAANVVLAPFDKQSSVPIALTSSKLEIDIVEDPQWSRETLWQAVDRFDKAQSEYISRGWDNVPMGDMVKEGIGERTNLEMEMQRWAATMALLDTEESLAAIVRRYDGASVGLWYYRSVFYNGIIRSRHRSLAIDLLSERMLQPDFWVSEELIDQLTAMKIESQFPNALGSSEVSYIKQLYPEAWRILHDYVLAVGQSLAAKNSNAYAPSLNVFKMYARQDFCTRKPLISRNALKMINRQIGASEQSSK